MHFFKLKYENRKQNDHTILGREKNMKGDWLERDDQHKSYVHKKCYRWTNYGLYWKNEICLTIC